MAIHNLLLDFWLLSLYDHFPSISSVNLIGLCSCELLMLFYDNPFFIESIYPFSYVAIMRVSRSLLISGMVYPASLSKIILARYPDSLSQSIISCNLFLSLSVSNLMRKVSLISMIQNSKLKVLCDLNEHY
jgi:hypothetical protein